MKRDMDLLRDLLSVVEMADYDPAIHHSLVARIGLHPYDPRVQYHLRLLYEAGMVRSVGNTTDGAVSVRLTWQGHEFLEMARNQVAWERAKNYVIERTHGLSASVLQKTLTAWSENVVGDNDGWRSVERRRLDLGHPVHAPVYGPAHHPVHSPVHGPYHTMQTNYAPNWTFAPHNGAGASKNGAATNGAAKARDATASSPVTPPRWPSYHPWDIPYSPDSYFQYHVWNGHTAESAPIYTPF